MYFHRKSENEPIKLSPISTIVCIPLLGIDDNDIVTSVRWQHRDGRSIDITLNCPEGGVKLSKNQATNFYLSVPATSADWNRFHCCAYVYLKNGAVQVKTPRNRERFEAGTLHRFPVWQLSKKAKWTFKYVGSEREHAMIITSQTPLGPANYMIDGNDISWWEFRRNSQGKMAGPHKVIIDLGKTEHIKGLKIKGPERKDTPSYKVKDEFGEATISVSNGYNAPYSVYASFLKEGELTEEFKNGFCNTKLFSNAQEKHIAEASKGIAYYYGESMKDYWDIKLTKEYDARYLVIHFYQCWNDGATGGAASKMKVAELDIY